MKYVIFCCTAQHEYLIYPLRTTVQVRLVKLFEINNSKTCLCMHASEGVICDKKHVFLSACLPGICMIYFDRKEVEGECTKENEKNQLVREIGKRTADSTAKSRSKDVLRY